MTYPPPLPPFKTLESILRRTTERLAAEVVAPSSTAPNWSELEWRIATAVVAIQGIAVQLAQSLRWRGPDLWEMFLAEQQRQMLLRFERIATILERLDIAALNAGVPIVELKGAALYRLGIYRPGHRTMGDIDILVHPSDQDEVERVLAELDYTRAFEMERHNAFEPKGGSALIGYAEHVDNPIKIELHTRVFERLPIALAEITADIFPPRAKPGLNGYSSSSALMRHLLLHAAGNSRAHALRMNQLHDIASLGARMDDCDWESLLSDRVRAGLWWALCPLLLTERYYPNSIPIRVIAAARRDCPRRLQRACERYRLTDVSWSNLRIYALPGIEWCRTWNEVLRFVRTRMAPKRSELIGLAYTAATQSWSRQVPWYGQSQLRRAARWLVGHPPRAQTMYSVQSALRQ